MDYQTVIERLKEMHDPTYQAFNEKLIPGIGKSYGVRIPQLRALAKEIAGQDFRAFLASARADSHEETMLQGLVIALARCDIEERLAFLKDWIPKIDNWAICDTVAAALRCPKQAVAPMYAFLLPYLEASEPFMVRFAVVMLMDHFLNEKDIDEVLQRFCTVRHSAYYVRMAVAWALSVCFVKYPEKTLPILEGEALDPFTHNKTIQKICESHRVEADVKAYLRTKRRTGEGM